MAKARDFKFWSISFVMTDCLLRGHGQGHVSIFYILYLENFTSIGVINKLVDGQLVDYIYDSRASCSWMHKFIIHWSTVTL